MRRTSRLARVGLSLVTAILMLAGAGAAWPASAELAAGACGVPALAATAQPGGQGTGEAAAAPDPRGVSRQDVEVTVVGGPSESVRVVAPPTVKATGVGGAGAPGAPGRSAQP